MHLDGLIPSLTRLINNAVGDLHWFGSGYRMPCLDSLILAECFDINGAFEPSRHVVTARAADVAWRSDFVHRLQ